MYDKEDVKRNMIANAQALLTFFDFLTSIDKFKAFALGFWDFFKTLMWVILAISAISLMLGGLNCLGHSEEQYVKNFSRVMSE